MNEFWQQLSSSDTCRQKRGMRNPTEYANRVEKNTVDRDHEGIHYKRLERRVDKTELLFYSLWVEKYGREAVEKQVLVVGLLA